MVFTKLVIAGSSGYVADYAIRAIMACTKPQFDVTILTRLKKGGKSLSIPGAEIIPVDHFNHDELVKAVTGADAILSFASALVSKVIDKLRIKVAQQAGVRRTFPSEYTLNAFPPEAVKQLTEGGNWPEDSSPVLMARIFLASVEDGGPTSFTTLIPSAFMDSWLQVAFGFLESRNRRVTVIDSGDNYFSGCSLPFLGDAVVTVADAYEEILGEKFERSRVTSRELLDQCDANLQAGTPADALSIMIHLAVFNEIGAGDLFDGLNFNGDGHLRAQKKTLRQLTIESLRATGVTSKES